jgi:hypothetical protein
MGKSRAELRVDNNLGVIPVGQMNQSSKKFRRDCLELYDSYYEGRQYAGLAPWDSEGGVYVPVRKRQPRLQFAFAKVLASRVAGKLVGRSAFPKFVNVDDPDWAEFIRWILEASNLKAALAEPMRRLAIASSTFVRFYLAGGNINVEHFDSKYCYPEFDEGGELARVMVRYVYEDPKELDEMGRPAHKWFQLELSQDVDRLYDNPRYRQGEEPSFQVVSEAPHELGYVQGEWFRLSKNRHNPDGDSLIQDVTGFIDELNYSLSQSSTAVQYNQDPQLAIKNMTEDEIEGMIRSATKGWNLGKAGEAEFLETTLTGVERAETLRDKVRLNLQDVTRIIMMDPEKLVAQAQSGVALEILHGPFVDLIDEIRPMVERPLVNLVTKMALTVVKLNQMGAPVPVTIPRGWMPQSIALKAEWQPVFPMTVADIQSKANLAIALTNASIASREWALRYLAADLGIDDIENELELIKAQPVINPFGAF